MARIHTSGGQMLPLQDRDPNKGTATSPSTDGSVTKSGSRKDSPPPKQNSKNDKDNKASSAADLSIIHLDGEEDERVPIYDTCDDVRKKINDLIKGPVTQAGFCRELTELMPSNSINPRQLGRFLKFKGPRAGGHSPAFYAGYVYFEKLRIRQGKKKSAKREKLEEAWKKDGGFPREGSHNMHLTCIAGESWRIDNLGLVQIKGEPSMRSGAILRNKPTK